MGVLFSDSKEVLIAYFSLVLSKKNWEIQSLVSILKSEGLSVLRHYWWRDYILFIPNTCCWREKLKYEHSISYNCVLLIHAVMHVSDLHPNFLLVEWWMYDDYVETILLLQAEIILLWCFHCREIRKNLNIPILSSSTIKSSFQSVNRPAVVYLPLYLFWDVCVCMNFQLMNFLLSFVIADRRIHVLFLKVESSVT